MRLFNVYNILPYLDIGNAQVQLMHVFSVVPSRLQLPSSANASAVTCCGESHSSTHEVSMHLYDLAHWTLFRRELLDRAWRLADAEPGLLLQLAFVCPNFSMMRTMVQVASRAAGMQLFLEIPHAIALEDVPVFLLRKLPHELLHRVASVSLLPAVTIPSTREGKFLSRLVSVIVGSDCEPARRFQLFGSFANIAGHLSISQHVADALSLSTILQELRTAGVKRSNTTFPGRSLVDPSTTAGHTVLFDDTCSARPASIARFNQIGALAYGLLPVSYTHLRAHET